MSGAEVELRAPAEAELTTVVSGAEPAGELDPPAALIPVDPLERGKTIYATVTGWRTQDRRAIVPAWLRSRREAGELARFLACHGAHLVAFHTVRVPVYLARLVWYTPRGGYRVARYLVDHVFDAEARPLRRHAVDRKDPEGYLRLVQERNTRVRARGRMVLAGLVVLVSGGLVIGLATPVAVRITTVLVVMAVLGKIGAPADRPLVASAVVQAGAAPVLKSEIVVRGLKACGIAAMNSKDAKITFVAPIQRDGPGWRAEIDLPYGVTVSDVMDQRDRLAGGLRRPTGCVWIEPVHDAHSGRLVLWVGDQDMSKAKQKPWPLFAGGAVDLFCGFPVGTDYRGRPVTVCLMFANMIIGAVPRMGKTFFLRLLLLATALDPIAEVHAYDLKGTGDLAPLEPICHAYAAGDDDEEIDYGLRHMRRLQAELRRRTKVIRNLPRDLCPESKVTRRLAERSSLGLHPIVVGVDECFPAGTSVGNTTIERLRPGDLVPSWDETTGMPCTRPVLTVFRNRPAALVRVHWSDGTSLVCTPGHPLMTRDGWCPAIALTPDSEVLTYGTTTATRHGGVYNPRDTVRANDSTAALLAQDRPGVLFTGVWPGGMARSSEATRPFGGQPCRPVEGDAGEQSDAQPGIAGEDVGHPSPDRPPAEGQRRQRTWTDRTATAARRSAGLADRARRSDRRQGQERATVALQARHRAPDDEDRGRDRRRLPLLAGPPRTGSAEGNMASWRGVDRVEVLQPGGDGRYGGLCPDGHVYNLEVGDTHTYRVAGGVIAHNCQRWFEHAQDGKEFESICDDLVRRGPAVGIILLLATQRVDTKSIPRPISSNAILRFCLKVLGHIENDMVLGTGAYKNGLRATLFTRSDRGIGWLSGEGDEPRITRGYYVDAPAAERVIKRAVAIRTAAGTLTGYAAGESPEPTHRADILEDLRVVFVSCEVDRIWSERACQELGKLRPEAYGDWTPAALATALRPHQLTPAQVWADGENRNGYRLDALMAAMAQREPQPAQRDRLALP